MNIKHRLYNWFPTFLRVSNSNNTITTSKDLANLLIDGLGTSSGVRITPKTAMGIASVQSAVRVLAENIGMLPFNLFEDEGGDKKRKAVEHPVHELINSMPNFWMTAQQFIETIVVLCLLHGNFYAFINKIAGKPRELIPIHPERVEVKQDKDTLKIIYRVRMANGTFHDFDQDQIFHVRDLSINFISGDSRVTQCRDALGLSKATENFGSRFFANNARPSGILTTSGTLNAEQVQLLRETWNEAHSDKNQLGTALLDGDFKWTAINNNPEEAQNLQTRKFQVTEIARIFRIPPHKIADMERANFSNLDAQELDFTRSSLMPWFVRIESAVDSQLLTKKERQILFSKFNANALLRGDTKARGTYYQIMKQNRIMTTNEIRSLEDLPPIKGGDVLENPQMPDDRNNQDNERDENERDREDD